MTIRAAFVSVVPSPYQRDLFAALSRRSEVDLKVFYLEAAAPDSPWPEKPLADYESILPGHCLGSGRVRFHLNWKLPDFTGYDVVVLGIPINALTAQYLTRFALRSTPWLFWGERLRSRSHPVSRTLHRLVASCLSDAAGIVAIGTQAEADYRQRFPTLSHHCIPYYCDLQPFIACDHSPGTRDDLTFFFCGQMIRRKGLDLLLTAFARLALERADIHLLLVGREAELPAMLEEVPAEVRSRVSYEGFQPPEKLPTYFAKADVFVLPSRYDGWGVVVNQALGAGVGVICSDTVGAGHDLVEDDINGLHFPSGDAEALYERLKTAATDRALASRWGKASREKAVKLLPEVGAERWVSVLRSTLSSA